MRALLIPDDAGNGHIVRCAALARELRRRDWKTFTVAASEQVPPRQFDVVVLDTVKPVFSAIPGVSHMVRIVDEAMQDGPSNLTVCANVGCDWGDDQRDALVGPEYALLRREFLEERGSTVRRVGVFDARKIAGWSAEALAPEMALAQVVISYGGMRALEAACVGTPTVLVHRNRGECLNAWGLAEAGAAVVSTESEAERAAELLLAAAPELLERMSDAAMALVDGKGCERVADAIEGLFR